MNPKEYSYTIDGMSCAACALTIEKEFSTIEGVKEYSVNYALEKTSFQLTDERLLPDVINKMDRLGYRFFEVNQSNSQPEADFDDKFRKFLISILLSVVLFSLAMWPLKGWPSHRINWILQMALATPIWIWIGFQFQKSVLLFLKTGHSNMNTLVGIGTSCAYIYSAFVTIFSDLSVSIGLTQKVYFEAIGFIISFVYLGKYFEEKAKRKTKEALNSLFQLSAKHALLVEDGATREIPVEKIEIADILRVLPGQKIPVDGVVVRGNSAIDESMISGEANPVTKAKDDPIFSGTINGDSTIDYYVTKVGADTFLAQIISFVERAQNSKPEIQKYTDKISAAFTPVVIAIAFLTFVIWFLFGPEPRWGMSISNMIAVLVIACPCALGLATPTAVVVATGRASLKGLLIAGGEVIEKTGEIDTIVFDKTGTLTEGRPEVIDFLCSTERNEILLTIGSIEQFSEHPISKAIVKFAEKEGLELDEPDYFEIVKGKGLIAEFEDKDYILGNKALFDQEGVLLDDNLLSKQVGTEVFIASNSKHVATIMIGDQIKSNSKDVIQELQKRGIKTWMITGDNERIAHSVATSLGIDHYLAAVLPLEKSKQIETLQASGHKVVMIGDGINDAPALAKADLSIAMGTGTDVAISASDVTIVKGDLRRVITFLDLTHGTMKIIKQNLFLSLVYNASLIPIAAGILVFFDGPLMPPVLASVAMVASSLSVVSNSLRIRKLI